MIAADALDAIDPLVQPEQLHVLGVAERAIRSGRGHSSTSTATFSIRSWIYGGRSSSASATSASNARSETRGATVRGRRDSAPVAAARAHRPMGRTARIMLAATNKPMIT